MPLRRCQCFGAFLLLVPAALCAQEFTPATTPPTAAEKASWAKNGRTLPTPEILQPTLDPALPSFTPAAERSIAAHFHGAASDVLAVLSKMWAEAFHAYYPNVVIDIPPPYSGQVGAKELVTGDVDFAMVSRELVPSDVTSFKAKFGYEPLSVPISGGSYRAFGFLDAVAFVVNKDNPIEKLSFAQLDALLSTTRNRGLEPIKTWGQLGLMGEWADKPITIYGVKPWNGFEEFVRERVMCPDGPFVRRGEWRDDIHFGETVFPVSPAVAKDRYAIGYSGLAYVTPGVKLVALSESDNGPFYPPSYEEVVRARYPLSRLIYCNLNKQPGKPLNPAMEEFLRFILSKEGQQVILKEAVYVPLRGGQAGRSRELLTK